jgi:hypothetical protein
LGERKRHTERENLKHKEFLVTHYKESLKHYIPAESVSDLVRLQNSN